MEVDKFRLAQFFLIIGIVLLVVFFGTDQSQSPQFGLFFIGALITGVGAFLLAKSYKPPPPSTRFQGIKKIMLGRNQPKPEKSKTGPTPGALKKKWFGFGKKPKQ
jgi:hypothetical protein